MLLSPWKNGLDSLFKKVRAFEDHVRLNHAIVFKVISGREETERERERETNREIDGVWMSALVPCLFTRGS